MEQPLKSERQVTAQGDSPAKRAYRQRWSILLVLSISLLIINIDDTIVNIAIPTLQKEFGASSAELQWILTAYLLVFAGLLLTMGSLGDKFGRKRALQAGLVIFAVASVFAAFSPGSLWVIASRAIMGLGAALIMPSTLSVIVNVFPRGERGKAIGIWTGVASLGIPLGPILGGLLLENFWWGSVFLINVPIALVALVAGQVLIPESRRPSLSRIDLPGMSMSTVALASLLYAITDMPQLGWQDPTVMGALAAAIVLGIGFVLHEMRTDHPMIDLRLFRNRRLSTATTVNTITFLAFGGLAFTAVQYLQIVRGLAPFATGAFLLPLIFAVMVGAGLSSKLVARLRIARTIALALVVVATGMALLSTVETGTEFWVIALALVFVGFGLGSAMAPATTAIMEAIPKDDAGVGSSLNDISRQLGAALGVSILGSLATWVYSSDVAGSIGGLPPDLADIASNSVGGAAQVAALLGGAEGAALLEASSRAFSSAFGAAAIAAAAVAVIGAFVVLRHMGTNDEHARQAGDTAERDHPEPQGG